MVYGSWDMEQNRQNFLSFWTIFCLFTLLTNEKSEFWKTEKNTWRNYHFTHVCINDNHMIYGFSDMESNWQIFLSFWTIFCPFTPYNNPENQNFEKMKKTSGDIMYLHVSTIKGNHIYYVWFLRYGARQAECFVILGHFLIF